MSHDFFWIALFFLFRTMCNAFIKKAAIIVHCVTGMRASFPHFTGYFFPQHVKDFNKWPPRSDVIYAIKCLLGS